MLLLLAWPEFAVRIRLLLIALRLILLIGAESVLVGLRLSDFSLFIRFLLVLY